MQGAAFFSAEDADSRIDARTAATAEGAFYVWTWEEIRRLLGSDAAMFAYHYGIEPGGNVPDAQDSQQELKGKNVLSEQHSVAETAGRFSMSEQDARARINAARRRLFDARLSRPRPPRDDKVLVAWNGLTISALSQERHRCSTSLPIGTLRAAAGFVEARLYDTKSGSPERRYRQGDANIDALLEDYAFLIQGLLDLYGRRHLMRDGSHGPCACRRHRTSGSGTSKREATSPRGLMPRTCSSGRRRSTTATSRQPIQSRR